MEFYMARPFLVISIHAAREGGDTKADKAIKIYKISIHAAREGGDDSVSERVAAIEDFNPRRP